MGALYLAPLWLQEFEDMATAKNDNVERQIAQYERAVAQLRQKLERQKAAADLTRDQMDLFEASIADLKRGK